MIMLGVLLLLSVARSNGQQCTGCYTPEMNVLIFIRTGSSPTSALVLAGVAQAASETRVKFVVKTVRKDDLFREVANASTASALIIDTTHLTEDDLSNLQPPSNVKYRVGLGSLYRRTGSSTFTAFVGANATAVGLAAFDSLEPLPTDGVLCLMEAELDTHEFNSLLCSASPQYRRVVVNTSSVFSTQVGIQAAITQMERETRMWGVKQRLLAVCTSPNMATIFNTVAVGYTYFSSISIAVVNPSIFDVDHLTRGTKNIAAVLDVAPYNQGYTAAHLALVMHRTGNVMLTTHQEFGPYIYTQNSTIPTRWRCALKALTYVMCPTYSADPDCPCINITQDIRMATVMHGSPRLRLTSFTTEAGMTSYLDGLGQPPQWDYYYPSSVGIPSEIANAMNTLLQSKPDVMITTVYYPEMAAVLRASGSLARHLITFNAGWSTVWPSFGSELFVGQDEYEAGYLVGAELRRRGVHANVVCLLEFDATKIEPRCEGVQAGLTPDGFMTMLHMATSVTQHAREFLSTTFGATITAWVSTSASSAVASSVAFRELGVTIPLFAFDISSAMMPLLDSEDIVLTIEQQSHLQGYMAVMHGVLSALTEQPVQTRFLRTGPVVVTRANMSTYYCESSGYRTCGPNDIIVPVSMLNNRGDIIVIDNRLNLVLFIASIGVLAFGIVLSVSITCQVDIQRVTLLQDVPSVNILFTGTVSSSLDRNLELSPRSPTTSKRLKGWMQGQQLGHGSYGVVYLALCSDGSFMAVKSIELLNGTTEAALNAMISEMQLMRSIPRHPHIVQYYGCEVDRIQRRLNILMEYVPGGSLGALARGLDVPFQESVVRRYTHQILLGLQYLHSLNIIHRDIKGDNILLTEGIVKLADFGTAKRFEEMGTTKGTISVAGTPLWMAPEVLTGAGNRRTDKKYDTKADIWSVGCTVVEMLNKGKPPWRNFSSLYEAVYTIGRSTGLPTGIPDGLSGECLRFLERCFERDVEKRADVDELLQHPFVNEEEPEGESPRGRVNVTLLNDVIATPTDRSGVPPISWSDSLGKSIHESV